MTTFSDTAWRDMHEGIWMARTEARLLMRQHTNTDLVITSGRRPQSEGGSSLHGVGQAMDIRIRHFGSEQAIHAFADELQEILGVDFDVVVEGPAARKIKYRHRPPHIHVEYDPKGRHFSADFD